MNLPELLRAKYFKKVCRLESAFEFHDETPITSSYYSYFHSEVASLKTALSGEDVQLLLTGISSVSCLLNRFLGLTGEEQKELTAVSKSVGALLLAVKGATSPTILSNACKQEETFIPVIMSFIASVLSIYPLNQDMTDLFESEIWTVVNQLSGSFADNPLLCSNIFLVL